MQYLKIAKDYDEIEGIYELIQELFQHSVYSSVTSLDAEDTKKAIETVIKGKPNVGACILLKNSSDEIEGLLACSIVEQMFNKRERTACELAFWIKPKYRNYTSIAMLVRAYKYWAKQVGCTSYMIGKMKNDSEVETYIMKKIKA